MKTMIMVTLEADADPLDVLADLAWRFSEAPGVRNVYDGRIVHEENDNPCKTRVSAVFDLTAPLY